MRDITADEAWSEPTSSKTLTIEHRMAAARMHFLEIFTPLYRVDNWRTSLLSGELPATRFFSAQVLPLVNAKLSGDRFAVARVVKARSPLLSAEALRAAGDQRSQLKKATVAIDELMLLWKGDADPPLRAVLRCIAQTGLFELPDILAAHTADVPTSQKEEDTEDDRFEAVKEFLAAPFSQVSRFATYVAGNAHFGTHQGVKGLEFDRVMVIMDDSDGRSFSFKYESLFGGKAAGDKQVEATRRLFYVTCSRAKKSLALVAFANDPERVGKFLIGQGWFDNKEIVFPAS
jgi:DNA helicase-2/ATP-dependent DNA helicase PcrA